MSVTTLRPYGEVMKAARERAKLLQEDVAAAMGVTQSTVSAWENMDREPNVTRFAQYMEVCKASRASLARVDPYVTARRRGVTQEYAIGGLDLVGCTPTPLAGDPHPPIERPEIRLPHAA